MAVGPVIAGLTGVPAGRLVDRLGAQRMTVGGLAGMMLGCAALSAASAMPGIAGFVLPMAVITASYALFQAANAETVATGMRVTFAVAAGLVVVALVIALGSQAAARRNRRSDAWAGGGSRP